MLSAGMRVLMPVGFYDLAGQHDCIGDVRGSAFFRQRWF